MEFYINQGIGAVIKYDDGSIYKTDINYDSNNESNGITITKLESVELKEEWVLSTETEYLDFMAIPKITGVWEKATSKQ